MLERVRRHEARDAIWGDDIAGFVADKVYRSDPALSFVVSSLPAGAHFTFSERAWPVSESCNLIYVLRGSFTALVPQTGEARTAHPGDVLVVPPRVWHFGYNFSDEAAEFIECLGPGQPGTPRKDLPKPATPFPSWDKAALAGTRAADAPALIAGAAATAMPAIIGDRNPLLGQILVNHPLAAALRLTLPAGRRSDAVTLPHDAMCYGLEGEVQLDSASPNSAFVTLGPDDAVYLPRRSRLCLANPGAGNAGLLLTLTGPLGELCA